FASAQRFLGGGHIELLHGEELFTLQRLRQLRSDGGDLKHFRGAVAKRNAQACGEKNRKRKNPEERFGLAQRFEEANDGQLHQRMFGESLAAGSFLLPDGDLRFENGCSVTHLDYSLPSISQFNCRSPGSDAIHGLQKNAAKMAALRNSACLSISQMASCEGDEHILQSCGMGAQLGERNFLARQFCEQ